MGILGICNSCGRTITTDNLYLKERKDGLNWYICQRCAEIINMVIKKYLVDKLRDLIVKT